MAWMARQVQRLRPLHIYQVADYWFQPLPVLRASSASPASPAQQRTSLATSCIACQENSVSSRPLGQKHRNFDAEFRNIYTFRYIVHTRVLSRFKIYQTLVTVGAMPPAFFMHSSGVLSSSDLVTFFGIASLATTMLYVMSTFFRHIVGIISVNKSEDIVRISHLTFWGRRRDVEFEVSDIVPLSDMSVKPNDIYQVIQFYEQRTRFYWFLRHGKTTDAEVIQRIFGKL